MIEARDNLHRFSLTFEQMEKLTAEDLCQFVESYISIKKEQLIDSYAGHDMVIYVWFDEPAGTLCVGLISKGPSQSLPFSCQIDFHASLVTVIEAFMGSPYVEGIPNAELTLMTTADEDVPPAKSTDALPVFVLPIP